jgi:hypothetical protein
MSSESPQPLSTGRDVCGAPGALGGVCRQPATHEVEVNAPKRGHDVSRRCGDCAESARGRTYVREVRPITLDVDAEEAAAAIVEHFRYTQATRDSLGYTPVVRVEPEDERLQVARGGVLYIANDSDWRPASALLKDAPSYFEVTRPTWADTSDWLEAASACVRKTITDTDGREWSLPTNEIAAALRAHAADDDGDDDGDAPPAIIAGGGRGRDAFLGDDNHWCDLCAQAFDSLKELVNHPCSATPAHDVNAPSRKGAPTTVHGVDRAAFQEEDAR